MTRSNACVALLVVCGLGTSHLYAPTAGAAGETSKAESAKKKAGSKPKDAEEPKPGPDVGALKAQLESGKEPEMLKALETIQQSNDPNLAPLVNDLLRRGSTPKVCEMGLQTAGKLKQESSSEVIAPYMQHRSGAIRREATFALANTRGPLAVAALRRGLRSGDSAVRAAAASGLGALGAREAVGDLLQALDHGVQEAAVSIGQLCAPEQCQQFAERTGRLGFEVLVSGFDRVLFRPPADMPDEQKIRIIARVRELGTPKAGTFIADVLARWPKEWEGRVKQALEAAAKALGRGGGS